MPLEVLLHTMRSLWDDGGAELDDRLKACALAEKAAPYLHARLAAVTHSGDDDAPAIKLAVSWQSPSK